MSILWIILIGFLAGVIAKLLHPGPNEPSGFILTTLLGIAGAFVATYLGQAIGWYRADERPVWSERSSARSSSWWYGASSPGAAPKEFESARRKLYFAAHTASQRQRAAIVV